MIRIRNTFLLALTALLTLFQMGYAATEEWSSLGSGTDGVVRSLVEYEDYLIVAGSFAQAGGEPASAMARWDGGNWSSLGSGVNGTVEEMIVHEGNLFVGGRFTAAGGGPANRIARFDGSSWSPLGAGMNDTVRALAVYDGNLIAAGSFTTAGGQPAPSIARWDGGRWWPLGGGLNGTVYALTIYEGELIAGGWFTGTDGIAANRIARWDGISWKALGSGMNDWVYTLAVHQGNLVAGGRFTQAGERDAAYIAQWNGAQWSPVGSGMNGWVRWLESSESLFAAGFFTEAGGKLVNHVAAWDASDWHALGEGTDSEVRTLSVFGGRLYAGGWFGRAGEISADHIARWEGPLTPTQKYYYAQFGDGSEGGATLFSRIVLLSLDRERAGEIRLEVFDDQGELITVDLNGEIVNGVLDLPIGPLEMVSLETDGQGPLVVGSVRLSSTIELSTVLLFGGSVGLAGVDSSIELKELIAPIQTGGGINSGIALMNLGPSQTILLGLRTKAGTSVASAEIDLVAQGHRALFVDQINWDTPPDFSDFEGYLVARGEFPLAATVILVTSGEFASQPVGRLP